MRRRTFLRRLTGGLAAVTGLATLWPKRAKSSALTLSGVDGAVELLSLEPSDTPWSCQALRLLEPNMPNGPKITYAGNTREGLSGWQIGDVVIHKATRLTAERWFIYDGLVWRRWVAAENRYGGVWICDDPRFWTCQHPEWADGQQQCGHPDCKPEEWPT
jgi:hypothetical protein